MKKRDIIMDLGENITDKSIKIEHLLSTAIYDSSEEKTIFLFSEIALDYIKKIKINSEKIIHLLMPNKH